MKLGILRPHQRDLKFALGDLEAIVLRELWESKDPLSVKEFQLKISHTRPVAVTTVATILDRLYRKGIVLRKLIREGGPHYVYSPRFTEDQFKHEGR
jgi:predicted transcriptional regulator